MLDRRFANHLVAPSNAIPEVQDHIARNNGYISHFEAGHGVLDGLRALLEKEF